MVQRGHFFFFRIPSLVIGPGLAKHITKAHMMHRSPRCDGWSLIMAG
jgi:hypothetical protein